MEKHLQGSRYEENEMEQLAIDGRKIGPGEKTYIVAEMSANHLQDFHRAVEIVHAAAEAGADALPPMPRKRFGAR